MAGKAEGRKAGAKANLLTCVGTSALARAVASTGLGFAGQFLGLPAQAGPFLGLQLRAGTTTFPDADQPDGVETLGLRTTHMGARAGWKTPFWLSAFGQYGISRSDFQSPFPTSQYVLSENVYSYGAALGPVHVLQLHGYKGVSMLTLKGSEPLVGASLRPSETVRANTLGVALTGSKKLAQKNKGEAARYLLLGIGLERTEHQQAAGDAGDEGQARGGKLETVYFSIAFDLEFSSGYSSQFPFSAFSQ